MSRDDFYASPIGAAYSAYMERPRLGRVIARTVWGGDSKPYYASMKAVADVPEGGLIVDCPCGAGPALRALRPGMRVRYIAVDLSPSMIRRACKRAQARGLDAVELIQADAGDLPLDSGSADLFLSFWGLHCFTDPEGALAEAGRILKPGGRLVGAALLRGDDTLRQRLLIRPETGGFGRTCTEAEIREWLRAAGLALSSAQRSGPMLFFEAELGAGAGT